MKNRKKFIINLFLLVLLPILLITVGFSALSTSLTIGGVTKFEPIGLIRVMSYSTNQMDNSTDVNSSFEGTTIRSTIDFTDTSSTATYNVTIRNLGQVDYYLEKIVRNTFSNDNIEYYLDGFQIGNVIHAGEEKTFTIKYKYKSSPTTPIETRLNSDLEFMFKPYNETDATFPTVYKHDGSCTFNGANNYITGVDCEEYWYNNYIDTGVQLYSSDNWQKDYEVGFTIEQYSPGVNISQSVFFNAKKENTVAKFPGLVFRRDASTANIELTQTINTSADKVIAKFTNLTYPLQVRIYRINGVIYYSVGQGALTSLQDMNNFNNPFTTTAWFGASFNEDNNTIMRNLIGTISHMYVKLGSYTQEYATVTFDPTDGVLSGDNTKTVPIFTAVGQLPEPTCQDKIFAGWYTDQSYLTKVENTAIVSENTTYYAKWASAGEAKIGDTVYVHLADAIAAVNDNEPTTIYVLSDSSTKISIGASKIVTLDCSTNIISNSASTFTLENYGTLRIIGGTFTNNSATGAINNEQGGNLTLEGTRVIASGSKQAIYNNGGTVLSTNCHYSNKSNNRAAVHNLNNGTFTLIGGTVTAEKFHGVLNDNGLVTIGTQDGNIEKSPIIQGSTYGIYNNQSINFYDGIAKGKTNAVYNESNISEMEANSTISHSTEVINGATYKTFELVPNE